MWLNGNPINYERDKQPNSQNLPDIRSLNFGLNLISRSNLIKNKNIVGVKLKKLFHYQLLGLEAQKTSTSPARPHFWGPIAAMPSARFSSAAMPPTLHIYIEGRVCERRRDSWSFRCPTHHITVENRRRIAAESVTFEA